MSIVTSKFSIDSHKRRSLLRNADGGASGTATLPVRYVLNLTAHVTRRARRPPKQRNSARISLQVSSCIFWCANCERCHSTIVINWDYMTIAFTYLISLLRSPCHIRRADVRSCISMYFAVNNH